MDIQVREKKSKLKKLFEMASRVVGYGGKGTGRFRKFVILLFPLFYVMIGFVSIDKGHTAIPKPLN